MKVTVLGSGTSQGVPVIACNCRVCKSIDPRDNRRRSSILVEKEGTTVVVDTGPDFRSQMLRAQVTDLNAVVFTHEHKDHVAGLDDVRAFNFKKEGREMDVYATTRVQKALKREYEYIFDNYKYPGVPQVKLHTIGSDIFNIGTLRFEPIDVMHYKLPVKGFRIGNFAYITDANYISEKEKEKLKNLDVLILNALRISKHLSHFNLEEALELSEELGAKKVYLTHISHLMGTHRKVQGALPSNVNLAYDGLEIQL